MSISINNQNVAQIHTPYGWLTEIDDSNGNIVWQRTGTLDECLCITFTRENSNNYIYIQVCDYYENPVYSQVYTFKYRNLQSSDYNDASTSGGASFIPVSSGVSILLKSNSSPTFGNYHINIKCKIKLGSNYSPATDDDAEFILSGKISSLGTGTDTTVTTLDNIAYKSLFFNSSVIHAGNLQLPFLDLSGVSSCYESMFANCSLLTSVPNLPATSLSDGCYVTMFYNCISLESVPSNLLPASNLSTSCYTSMFEGCSSLTTAPDLLSTSGINGCYGSMFKNCTNLNYIKCMLSYPYHTYTSNWVNGVTGSGTFVGNSGTQSAWESLGVIDGIPSNFNFTT